MPVITAIVYDPFLVFLLLVTMLAVAYFSHILPETLKIFRSFALVFIFFFAMNVLFVPLPSGSSVLLYLIPPNYLPIGPIGILKGLTNSTRFLMFFLLVNIIFMITPIQDMLAAMVKFRVPAEVAVSLSIAFSYIPVMVAEIRTIIEAQRSKGAPFETHNPLTRMQIYGSLAIPTLYLTLLRGMDIAKAIEAKCFAYAPSKRTFRRGAVQLKKADYIVIGVILLGTATILTLKIALGWFDYTFTLEKLGLFSVVR
jgi:energy-coupling factor transport system permease protein